MRENQGEERFASWWQPLTRREFAEGSAALAALATLATTQGGCCLCAAFDWNKDETPETETVEDSLKLQQEHGWAVGQEDKPLDLPGRTDTDSRGSQKWKLYLSPSALIAALTPASESWQKYFVPTLVQSLGQNSLAMKMAPVYDEKMHEAEARGRAIGKTLLPATEKPGTTMLVIDMPGREAVAMAAGLADSAHLAFAFDNWPHPIGVVKSHETLAALLYYADEIAEKKTKVPEDAPLVMVLDSNRLAPFSTPDTQFDNRYIAKMPEPDALKAKEIKNVLYITPDRTREQELDDLNDLFVEYKKAGLEVGLLPATDLQRSEEPVTRTVVTEAGPRQVVEYNYYYGGYPHTHFHFFAFYPFWVWRPAYIVRTGVMYRGPIRPPVFSRPMYAPVARPTAFSGYRMGAPHAGVGRMRPTGFGRTTIRMSGGRLTGVRAGRAGSFGRAYSG